MTLNASTVRLARKHPTTGQIEERCYYVMDDRRVVLGDVDERRVGSRLLGRVRFNDGWNAATPNDAGGFDSVAGWWRTRYAAVNGLLDEVEEEDEA